MQVRNSFVNKDALERQRQLEVIYTDLLYLLYAPKEKSGEDAQWMTDAKAIPQRKTRKLGKAAL